MDDNLLLQKVEKILSEDDARADEYDIFGTFVASELRNLRRQLSNKLKRKIQQCILDVTGEQEDAQTTNCGEQLP